ncbi:uncharacterized protein LOC124821891 [Vigna umbellata]|uniref:uncharacterized protein LOC124821891 n=1 Tax=Vigna umbellata TaxID=87088 RepID=UPI001F5FECBD|nr:uncharacterized protein LOC124821891 [Vigna umbellata]
MDHMDQSTNPASPFYLHPGENPGLTLISQVLSETNYSSWSRSMRRALLSKNKIKFIDGSIKKPQRSEVLFDAWEKGNMMVLSWIIKTLSPQIVESVIYVEEAKELWDELKERFSKGDYFKIFDLLQDIHSIKQGERSVSQFFTDLKILWEELEFLRPIPNYSGTINHNQTAETKVLANVVDKKNNWRPDQTWKNQGREPGSGGQGRGRGRNPNYGKQCSYCNKMNHIVDECYSKHSYPPWYKKNDSNQDKKVDWNSANVCQSSFGSDSVQATHQGNTNVAFTSFTPEQMHKLLRMIEKVDESTHKINQIQRNNTEGKQDNFSSIIDTRATDHVIRENSTLKMIECANPYKGHPGHKTVKQICESFPYVQMSPDIICDTCHYAKQHKLPFP